MDSLAASEAAIRSAVAAGAYSEAGRLLADHCRQITTLDQKQRAIELLHWIFRLTSATRAHDVANLKNLAAVAQYLRTGSRHASTLQIDG